MFYLRKLSRTIDSVNIAIGRAVCWLALAMVLLQFAIVVLRYVFGVGSLAMHETVVYMHGVLFMMAGAYTLAEDGHVRVDIFYRDAAPRKKAMINLFGVAVFLAPICILILYLSYPYVARSWSVLEGSRETSGLPGVFLFKTVILVFAGLLLLQGVSIVVRAVDTLLGNASDPGAGARDREQRQV